MYEAIFHPALWMPAVGVIIGVIVFVLGNNRVHAPTRQAGFGLIGATFLWCVAAYLVNTPVEQAIDRTKGIVDAVEKADWAKLKTLIDPSTTMEGFSLRGPEMIASTSQTAAETYALKDIKILSTDAVLLAGDEIEVTIFTMLDGAQPTTGTFKFAYAPRSDGLLLSRIIPVSIGGHDLSDVRQLIR